MTVEELGDVYITLLNIRGDLRYKPSTQKSLCLVRDEIARMITAPVEIVQNVYENKAEEVNQ